MKHLDDYTEYVEEVVYYHDCNFHGLNPNEPCWGRVIKDTIHLPNFAIDPIGRVYYTCKGYYDCIEGGAYQPK